MTKIGKQLIFSSDLASYSKSWAPSNQVDSSLGVVVETRAKAESDKESEKETEMT